MARTVAAKDAEIQQLKGKVADLEEDVDVVSNLSEALDYDCVK